MDKNTGIFITACGTEIGKTYFSCALIRALKRHGKLVQALKPAISGLEGVALEQTDSGLLLQALETPITPETMQEISPWQFAAALTPSMAAALEGKTLDAQEITDWCLQQINKKSDHITLVEGAGGVMAPLTETHTMRDWVKMLNVPSILVVGSYLGSLSHALTAVEALKTHSDILAVVVNEIGEPSIELEQTQAQLRKFLPDNIPVITLEKDAHLSEGAWNILAKRMAL